MSRVRRRALILTPVQKLYRRFICPGWQQDRVGLTRLESNLRQQPTATLVTFNPIQLPAAPGGITGTTGRLDSQCVACY